MTDEDIEYLVSLIESIDRLSCVSTIKFNGILDQPSIDALLSSEDCYDQERRCTPTVGD